MTLAGSSGIVDSGARRKVFVSDVGASSEVSTSVLGPVDPSFRALSGRLKLTVLRHNFNQDSLPLRGAGEADKHSVQRIRYILYHKTNRRVLKFQRIRLNGGGLVFKAHRVLYHSTLGLRVIKKKRSWMAWAEAAGGRCSLQASEPLIPLRGMRVVHLGQSN